MDTILAAIAGLMLPGILVAIGFMLVFFKLKRRTALRCLGHPILIDVLGFTLAFITHGGATFAGGMAATTAGIIIAITTSEGRRWFGYIESNIYHPGIIKYDPESLK